MEDLRITAARIDAVEALAELFSRHLRLSPQAIKEACLEAGLGDQLDRITWSRVLQTAWAVRTLTGQMEFRPLAPAEAQQFLRTVFEGAPGTPARRLDPGFTRTLLLWTAERTGQLGDEVQAIIREWIEAGAVKIEEELGGLDPEEPIDSRFIHCLCISAQTFSEGRK